MFDAQQSHAQKMQQKNAELMKDLGVGIAKVIAESHGQVAQDPIETQNQVVISDEDTTKIQKFLRGLP